MGDAQTGGMPASQVLFAAVVLTIAAPALAELEGFPFNALHHAGRASIPSATASGPTLYMFNNSHQVPGNVELFEFDVTAKTYKTVFTSPMAQNDCVSGSVICGDTYYAVWTQVPVAAGVLKIDLKTGKSSSLPTGGEGYIYHTLRCNPKNASSIIGLASKMGGKPGGGLAFQLVELDTTDGPTAGDSTVIGEFPKVTFGGYDGTFKFTDDGTQVYATFPGGLEPTKKNSDLYIMDMATGKVTEHHKLPPKYGQPYTVFPTGKDTFRMSFLQHTDVTLCTVDKSSGGPLFPAKLTDCKAVSEMYAGSTPSPMCQGKLYAVGFSPAPGNPQVLNAVDVSTGAVTSIGDLDTLIPGAWIGTTACGN